jgi:hypothetical protein
MQRSGSVVVCGRKLVNGGERTNQIGALAHCYSVVFFVCIAQPLSSFATCPLLLPIGLALSPIPSRILSS